MRAMVLTRARRRIAFHFQKSAAIHMRRHSCVPGSSGTGHIALAGQGLRMGVYGFGAAAHIITQVALHQRREVYAFAAPGDHQALHFSRDVGATWAGFSNEPPPRSLDSAIIFAPVDPLVPEALSRVLPGGVVVCAGIHMSDIPSFPYRLLWEERTIRSVANLTRRDAREFLALAAEIPLTTHVYEYALTDANQALDDLRAGRLSGAAVLIPICAHRHIDVLFPMSDMRREARRNREEPQLAPGLLRDRQGHRLTHFQVTEDRPARGINIGASCTACAARCRESG